MNGLRYHSIIYSAIKIPILDFFKKTHKIMNQLKNDLQEKNLLKGYCDEGGFWPHNIYHEEILLWLKYSFSRDVNRCNPTGNYVNSFSTKLSFFKYFQLSFINYVIIIHYFIK